MSNETRPMSQGRLKQIIDASPWELSPLELEMRHELWRLRSAPAAEDVDHTREDEQQYLFHVEGELASLRTQLAQRDADDKVHAEFVNGMVEKYESQLEAAQGQLAALREALEWARRTCIRYELSHKPISEALRDTQAAADAWLAEHDAAKDAEIAGMQFVLERVAQEVDEEGIYGSVHPRIVAMAADALSSSAHAAQQHDRQVAAKALEMYAKVVAKRDELAWAAVKGARDGANGLLVGLEASLEDMQKLGMEEHLPTIGEMCGLLKKTPAELATDDASAIQRVANSIAKAALEAPTERHEPPAPAAQEQG